MSVLVVGMSHQSAPVALLEKLSMDSAVQDSACGQLVAAEPLSEAMIISTCNRMEVYTVTNSFHPAFAKAVCLTRVRYHSPRVPRIPPRLLGQLDRLAR